MLQASPQGGTTSLPQYLQKRKPTDDAAADQADDGTADAARAADWRAAARSEHWTAQADRPAVALKVTADAARLCRFRRVLVGLWHHRAEWPALAALWPGF
jgi:hypothetical protein